MADEVLMLAEELVAGYLGSSAATRTAGVLGSISGGIVAALDEARSALPEPPRLRVQAAAAEFPHAEYAKVPVMIRLEIAATEEGEEVLGTDPGTAVAWFHKVKLDLRDLSQWDGYLRDLDGAAWGCRGVTPVTISTEADVAAEEAEKLRVRLTTGVLLTMLGASTGAPSGDPIPGVTVDASRTLLGYFTAAETMGSPRFVRINGDGEVELADRSTPTEASGYTLSSVLAGESVAVYDGGKITGLSGMTPGATQYLGINGLREESATSTGGEMVQRVGKALSATALAVDMEPSLLLS